MNEEELQAIEARASAATPGPWHVRYLDDAHAMNLVAISTEAGSRHLRWPDFDANTMVAATLIQEPRYVDLEDGWDENANFIAHARSDIPALLAEVRRLRAELAAIRRVDDNDSGFPGIVAPPSH